MKESRLTHGAVVSSARRERRSPRPALAPGVQLLGELPGTSFVERQWLAERDGRYIQLSELLYRIAEHADGTKPFGDIARAVTATTDWKVSASQVRELVEKKLRPLGLVTLGGLESTGEAPAMRRPGSPLQVAARVKVLGPGIVHPIAGVLQALFWPPLLVLLLALIVAGHVWLYFAGALRDAVLAVIYAPSLMLPIVPIALAAAVFHEFGHAAGLRYGGGRVRGMGVGIYAIYPVLYTDVTDSYRLPRIARLRAGLGGVYFHLLFALGTIAVSVLTGHEFLLLLVLLINLDVVRQFVPFLRLDGYWVLSDLTGIPDMLSHLPDVLRSFVKRNGTQPMPTLKPWARRVFITYIALTVPVLAGLLVLLVVRLPWLLSAIWDSLLLRVNDLQLAAGTGDIGGSLAVVGQMLLLMLPLAGLLYFFTRLGVRVANAFQARAQPVPGAGTR